MSDTLMIIIIVAAVLATIGGIAGFFLMRYQKGSIKVTLSKRGYSPGEKVTGSYLMTIRKTIEGRRLFAALIGEEVRRERYRDSNGRESTRTRTQEIFRTEQTIEEGMTYAAGKTIEGNFEIDTPSASYGGESGSGLGSALELGMELFTGTSRDLRWKVEVRLDASGIDLSDSESVTINVPG